VRLILDEPLLAAINEHLDSTLWEHHDVTMRTTITLEKDVERMLRDAMHRSRKSFKETLNSAVRAGLGAKPVRTGVPQFTIKARSLGLRSGIDPPRFNKLADDLEIDAFLDKNVRVGKKRR